MEHSSGLCKCVHNFPGNGLFLIDDFSKAFSYFGWWSLIMSLNPMQEWIFWKCHKIKEVIARKIFYVSKHIWYHHQPCKKHWVFFVKRKKNHCFVRFSSTYTKGCENVRKWCPLLAFKKKKNQRKKEKLLFSPLRWTKKFILYVCLFIDF